MVDELEEKCNKALAKCLDQTTANADSQKAVHYSQAAQNLSHVKVNLESLKSQGKAVAKKGD